MRRIASGSLILAFATLASCKSGFLGGRDPLSYAQYNSLQRGVQAAAVRDAFGTPTHVFERDGAVAGFTYPCENSAGVVVPLKLVFTSEGRLDRWALQE